MARNALRRRSAPKETVSFKLDRAEARELDRAAQLAGMNRSEFLRSLVQGAVSGGSDDVRLSVQALEVRLRDLRAALHGTSLVTIQALARLLRDPAFLKEGDVEAWVDELFQTKPDRGG